jgi:hypothetical protein
MTMLIAATSSAGDARERASPYTLLTIEREGNVEHRYPRVGFIFYMAGGCPFVWVDAHKQLVSGRRDLCSSIVLLLSKPYRTEGQTHSYHFSTNPGIKEVSSQTRVEGCQEHGIF